MPYLILIVLIIFNFPAFSQVIEEDESAVRILAYYGIGQEASPATSVTTEQFKAHMKELAIGEYNVIALPDMLKAYEKNAPLPKNSIVITFDGSDKSVLTHAAPLLKKLQYPFTVFISPEHIHHQSPRYLNHKDIKRLQKLQLVTFGIHPEYNEKDDPHNLKTVRQNLNNAVSFYRSLFDEEPHYLAFTNGLYSQTQLDSIKNYQFQAVFGQQSAVAYKNAPNLVLPRFIMTENYADLNRFNMVANALPLPIHDLSPEHNILKDNTPDIGFTASEDLNLERLSCYASGQKNPLIEQLNNRIEIRLKQQIHTPRFRVNCTIPVKQDNAPLRWRWFGVLLNTVH